MMKKRFFAVLFVVLLLFITACQPQNASAEAAGTDNTSQTDAEIPAQSDLHEMKTLRVGAQTLPSTLDPNASVSNAGIQVYYNIIDTLIMRDPHADPLTFVPGLAESWEQTDELTWEIKLRPDVKFHDGTMMTAEDVI